MQTNNLTLAKKYSNYTQIRILSHKMLLWWLCNSWSYSYIYILGSSSTARIIFKLVKITVSALAALISNAILLDRLLFRLDGSKGDACFSSVSEVSTLYCCYSSENSWFSCSYC